jgi:hypothetical protein
MKILILIAILTTAAPAFSQDVSLTIGAIDFFGQDGLNINLIRAALPLREGDQLSRSSKEKVVGQLREAIKRSTGREPSDVATICCDDRGKLIIYIGLRGDSMRQTLYNVVPRGSARLPPAALEVHRDAEKAWMNAMEKGVSGEDDSQGYALSLDPEARTRQLALHAYVARHSAMVGRVLASSRDVKHRQIAAEMLGYADRSREQIRALVRASRDVDDGVRNNAIRALVVLARSSSKVSAMIPGECFVDLLNSGLWTDRNKSAELLSVLTGQRDRRLLACLREQALTSLVEMSRWSYSGHTFSARTILERVTTQTNNGNNASPSCPICAALK